VTEDRKGNGLILDDNIQRNITLANLTGVSKLGVINEHEEMTVAADFLKKLRIRAQGVTHVVANLSGGNQQKVVLSKWLFSGPEVLILDEPTRGIDVGAKYEIYSIINQAVEAGKCVVMISSEMPELLGMCDRVYVMNEGRFVGEFTAEEVSQEKIMRAIMRNGGI
jgi:putative multiple sugar transport system ATP-binding protein